MRRREVPTLLGRPSEQAPPQLSPVDCRGDQTTPELDWAAGSSLDTQCLPEDDATAVPGFEHPGRTNAQVGDLGVRGWRHLLLTRTPWNTT